MNNKNVAIYTTKKEEKKSEIPVYKGLFIIKFSIQKKVLNS